MTMWTLRPLSIGEILDTTVGVYRKAFLPLVLLSLATQGILLLWGLYAASQPGFEGPLLLSLRLLALFTLGAVGSGASTFIVSETYVGRSLTMGEALRRALPFIGRIVMTSLLVALASLAAMFFFVVPGVIVFCALLLSTPALVLEGLPGVTAAMGRSWRLTSGLRGRTFVVLFVGILLVYVPVLAIGALSGATGQVIPSVVLAVVTAMVQILVYPYFYVALTVLYYDARVRKEGFDLDILTQSLLPP